MREQPRKLDPPRRTPPQAAERESDDSLLGRVGDGDRGAWAVLVQRHLPPVTRYANYVLHDAALAEDVAQESFIRLMRKAPDWQAGGASVRTWLFRPALDMTYDLGGGRYANADRELVMSDNGWTPFLRNLEVVETPGDHDGMVLEPNVRSLAAALREVLEGL